MFPSIDSYPRIEMAGRTADTQSTQYTLNSMHTQCTQRTASLILFECPLCHVIPFRHSHMTLKPLINYMTSRHPNITYKYI